ncbi:aldolase [Burkholderia sp. PAMC 28687]|uniref:HpcH/HpaI aldolase/citrate lyase family protein n=1 Tax=Burkholderia sp. PAMC 28687 TaxID=1795874 RepID=UPI000783EA0C|nr:CoA ester lyase [Burkholderia sp. PAMC 28687]AMM16358.1 aldolase [Burkholderia sp. PAMC 28687]
MPLHSYLFVPGDRPERFSKALATAAHQVVIDLEDAVAPEGKIQAREGLSEWLRDGLPDIDKDRVVIRVNAYGTPWHEDDVKMLRESAVTRIMVPKAEAASELADIASRCGKAVSLIALIESVAGVVEMRAIAHEKAVSRLAFGSFDYCVDAGVEDSGRELDYVRSQFVIESRYAGLAAPVDGVTLSIDDADLIAADAASGRRFGFGAKLCIHPKQVEAVNRGFAPSDADFAWAERVLAKLAENPRGAIAVDGKLVDKPIVDKAKRIVASFTR